MNKTSFYINERDSLRLSGISLALAGLIYAVVQFIHPKDELKAVSTNMFVVVAVLSILMSLLSIHCIYGLYKKQEKGVGLLGFIGMLLFNLFWLVSAFFGF